MAGDRAELLRARVVVQYLAFECMEVCDAKRSGMVAIGRARVNVGSSMRG